MTCPKCVRHRPVVRDGQLQCWWCEHRWDPYAAPITQAIAYAVANALPMGKVRPWEMEHYKTETIAWSEAARLLVFLRWLDIEVHE